MNKHGHYCKVCGEYKANEKFSGKGHSAHICKACSALPPEKQAEEMTLNRLVNLPWRLSKNDLTWLKKRATDKRPEVKSIAQEQLSMRFPTNNKTKKSIKKKEQGDRIMTKTEFVEKVAAESGLTKKQADESVKAMLKVLTDALSTGEKVSFPGFGSFEVRERAAREGKNPRTGEVVQIAACKTPAFKAGKALKDFVNK